MFQECSENVPGNQFKFLILANLRIYITSMSFFNSIRSSIASIHHGALGDDDPLPEQKAAPQDQEGGNAKQCTGGYASVVLTPELQGCKAGNAVDVMITLSANSGELAADNVQGSRPGVDLIAVIDVSGSMSEYGKIDNAVLTAKFIVDSMAASDRVSIVSFSNSPNRLMKLTRLDDTGKAKGASIAEGLKAEGGTNILKALNLAFDTFRQRTQKNSVSGIMLLTDGLDSTTISGVKKSIAEYKAQSIPLHTMAFGADHNVDLLRQIAEETLGTYSFIENAELVSDAVAPALAGMLSIVSKSTSISVTTKNAVVKAVESGAYKNTFEKNRVEIQAGDCYDGESRKFLVTLDVKDVPVELKADWTYKDPMTEQQKNGSFAITLSGAPADEIKSNYEVSEFKLNVLFKNALKAALMETKNRSPTKAREILEKVLKEVQEYPHAIPEDTKKGIIGEINNNLESVKQLEKSGPAETAESRAVFAQLSAVTGEMEVQRAGLNAMKKSEYSRAKYSTKAQEAVQSKAAAYWSSNKKA